MDPLSFVILRRIGTKIADAITFLLDFSSWLDGKPTNKDYERMFAKPGEPGYLPPKKNESF